MNISRQFQMIEVVSEDNKMTLLTPRRHIAACRACRLAAIGHMHVDFCLLPSPLCIVSRPPPTEHLSEDVLYYWRGRVKDKHHRSGNWAQSSSTYSPFGSGQELLWHCLGAAGDALGISTGASLARPGSSPGVALVNTFVEHEWTHD